MTGLAYVATSVLADTTPTPSPSPSPSPGLTDFLPSSSDVASAIWPFAGFMIFLTIAAGVLVYSVRARSRSYYGDGPERAIVVGGAVSFIVAVACGVVAYQRLQGYAAAIGVTVGGLIVVIVMGFLLVFLSERR